MFAVVHYHTAESQLLLEVDSTHTLCSEHGHGLLVLVLIALNIYFLWAGCPLTQQFCFGRCCHTSVFAAHKV